MVGGHRGLWSLRVPFEHCGARMYVGQIANAELRQRFETTIVGFMDLVDASKHYPCIKTAWVEFLGGHPDLAVDRVQ